MKKQGISKSAQRAQAQAEAAQAKASAAQAAAIEAANNMTQNYKTDLSKENKTQVVAGGSADAADTAGLTDLKKKKQSAALSSQLGLA